MRRFCLFLFVSFPSFANNLETQNNELQRKLKQNEIRNEMDNSLKKFNDKSGVNEIVPHEKKSENSIYVEKIIINQHGENAINLQCILSKYEHRNLDKLNIYNLIKDLSNHIYDKGYITSVVTLSENAYKEKNLYLDLNWGRISGFNSNNKSAGITEKLIAKTSFPRNRGDILNINDLDQAIENSNSRFQMTKVQISASENEGFSNVDYSVNKNYMPALAITVNNGGNGNKNGRFKYDATINHGSLLNLNERYTAGASSRKFHTDGYVENNRYFSFGMPYGYYDFSTFYSRSYSKNPLIIFFSNYPYESKLKSYNFNLKRKVFREKYNSSNIKFSLNFKETKNYLDNELLDSSSNNYTDYVLGFDTVNTNKFATFYFETNFLNGISGNNGSKGAYHNNSAKNVRLLNGVFSVQKYVNMFDHNALIYSTTSYQYAGGQNLVGSYKSTIGDEFSIRGLNSSTSLSYDSSVYVNNNLSFPMNFHRLSFKPFLGIDLGMGKSNNFDSHQSFYSTSAGLKIDYSTINLSVSYGKLLHISNERPKSGIFYFNMSVRN